MTSNVRAVLCPSLSLSLSPSCSFPWLGYKNAADVQLQDQGEPSNQAAKKKFDLEKSFFKYFGRFFFNSFFVIRSDKVHTYILIRESSKLKINNFVTDILFIEQTLLNKVDRFNNIIDDLDKFKNSRVRKGLFS